MTTIIRQLTDSSSPGTEGLQWVIMLWSGPNESPLTQQLRKSRLGPPRAISGPCHPSRWHRLWSWAPMLWSGSTAMKHKNETPRTGATSGEHLSVPDLVQDWFAVDSTIRHQGHLEAVHRPEQSILPAMVQWPEPDCPARFPVTSTWAPRRWRLTRTRPLGSSPPVTLALVRPEALRATPFSTATA
jgi:hypothetical protein